MGGGNRKIDFLNCEVIILKEPIQILEYSLP